VLKDKGCQCGVGLCYQWQIVIAKGCPRLLPQRLMAWAVAISISVGN